VEEEEDVDEVPWPDRNRRQDEDKFVPSFFIYTFLSFFVDCCGLFSIVCSVKQLEQRKKLFCCIFVCFNF